MSARWPNSESVSCMAKPKHIFNQSGPGRLRGLAIRQPVAELQHRGQSESGRRGGGLATAGK